LHLDERKRGSPVSEPSSFQSPDLQSDADGGRPGSETYGEDAIAGIRKDRLPVEEAFVSNSEEASNENWFTDESSVWSRPKDLES
jgi:hypothetical protein